MLKCSETGIFTGHKVIIQTLCFWLLKYSIYSLCAHLKSHGPFFNLGTVQLQTLYQSTDKINQDFCHMKLVRKLKV